MKWISCLEGNPFCKKLKEPSNKISFVKKKKASTTRNKKKTGKVKQFSRDERVKLIFGIFFVLFALYLLLAFVSFLFTWKVDQSLEHTGIFSSPDIAVENWAGKTGAYLGILFIKEWFGIASFFIPILLLLTGLRLLNLKILPLGKTIRNGILAIILFSVTLGYISGNHTEILGSGLGGGHGYVASIWLNSILGKVGTGFLLFFLNFAFFLFTYKPAMSWFTRKKIIKQASSSSSPVNIGDKDDFEIIMNDEPEIKDNPVSNKRTKKSNESDPHLAFTTKSLGNKDEKKEKDIDVELTVEKKKEEDNINGNTVRSITQENYDPTLDLPGYQSPTLQLLEDHYSENSSVSKDELLDNKNKIVETLRHYKIEISKIKATIGPTITLYEIIPEPGVRIAKIKNLEDDIALSLSALGIRIIAPIPGKGTIGIEVPNKKPEIVSMKSLLSSRKFQDNDYELPIALGKTISNETFSLDLTKLPHLLVAGATGQGKSVGLNVIIASLLYKKHPSELKFIFIDPKKVELTLYSKIERHFLAKLPDVDDAIITDTQKVINTLNSLTIEMDSRYDLLKKAHVRNIKEYNEKFINRRLSPEKGHRYMPYIVMVIDEFADLIMTAGREIEGPLARIAQIARAIGIHLVIATQRPTTNIITGVIKANFPARLAFRVTAMIDSRTILDSPGANQLIGRGDMLISTGGDLNRIQCAYIDTPEIERITDFIGSQKGYATAFLLPEYSGDENLGGNEIDDTKRDSSFEEAARLVVLHQQGSTSLIQRKLSIGYNRAGRIIDQLEAAGIVGPFEGSKARKVLFMDEYSLEQFLNETNKKESNESNKSE